MKTHVEFRSDGFSPYVGEEEEVNPGRWGKRLAEFIHAELNARGINAAEPSSEDWGWRIDVPNEAFPIWIGCGNYEEYENGFLCFIEPSTPFIRKMIFRKISTEVDVERVQNALENILANDSRIGAVRWQTREEFGL